MPKNPRRAFTLIELVIVLGIIIALAAIFLPAINRARESAKRAQCLNNVRQLTGAWLAYASENGGHFCSALRNTGDQIGGITPGFYWGWLNTTPPNPLDIVRRGSLWQSLNNVAVYRCPDDRTSPTDNKSSYAVNGLLAGSVGAPFPLHKVDEITNAPRTFVFIEQADPHILITNTFTTPIYPSPTIAQGAWPGENHRGAGASAEGTAVSFADGHAVFWQYSDARTGNLMQLTLSGPSPVNAAGVRSFPNSYLADSQDVLQLEAWSGGPVPPNAPF
jgi:type II secretory pathway pseudopilin PulG